MPSPRAECTFHIYPLNFQHAKHVTYGSPCPSQVFSFWSDERIKILIRFHFRFGCRVHNFALEPVELSDDKKKLRVKFYRLPRSILDVLHVPTIPDTEDGAIHEVGLWDVRTDQRIRSGHVLDINTDDPEKLPFPDLRLLGMQSVLNRISGAGSPEMTRVTMIVQMTLL